MKTSKKDANHTQWLEQSVAENLGVMRQIEGDGMLLKMECGSFSKDDLWFLRDEDNEEYVVFPQKVFTRLLGRIKSIQEEKFFLKLEKDIISQMPIDFDDAMAVAKSTIEAMRQNDGSLPEISTSSLAKEMKKEYPNLFFSIEGFRKKEEKRRAKEHI